MYDFTKDEKKTGQCRCGQMLWEMPMMDCGVAGHHDPDFIPSNPHSPFHAGWLRNGRKVMDTEGPVDPTDNPETRDAILAIIKEGGMAEATHLEAFISALNGITPAEHAEAAQWLRNRRLGLEVGEPPPGITKSQNVVEVDDRFWQIAEEYKMHDTDFRLSFLMSMAIRLMEHHAKGTR